MTKRVCRQLNAARQKGFTLIELMVSLGLSGLIFMVLMTLMGQGANFSSIFEGSANTIEALSGSISQLNSVMPQIVRINTCGCRGANSTNMSNCVWNESATWFDPHFDGGGVSANHILLDADYESFYGGSNTQNTTQLSRTNLPAGFAGELGGCNATSPGTSTGTTTFTQRGCKQRLRLQYTPAVVESGLTSSSTPSTAGAVKLWLGDQVGKGEVNIGLPTKSGMRGVGVTELSCGFLQGGATGTAGQAGLLFVLNMKIKSRSTTSQNPGFSGYESWFKTGVNYSRGMFRELRLKYSFPNISYRGVYQWRPLSRRDCVENGGSAGSKEECCSLAISGGTCIACVAGGANAASDNMCCSERRTGGVCK